MSINRPNFYLFPWKDHRTEEKGSKIPAKIR